MNIVCLINIPLVKNLGNIMDFISFITKNEENITFENPTTIDQTMAKKYCIELSISFLLVKYHFTTIKIKRKSFLKQVEIEDIQDKIVFKEFCDYVEQILWDISDGNIPRSFANFKEQLWENEWVYDLEIVEEEINKANFHLIKNNFIGLSDIPLISWYYKIISHIILEMVNEEGVSQYYLYKMAYSFDIVLGIIERNGDSSSFKYFAERLALFIKK